MFYVIMKYMKKILIAEDDIFIRDIAEKKLVDAGYEVHKTADGAAIIDMVEQINPDLLLLDLMLPNVHGYDILEQLRARETFSDLPVIVFSNEMGSEVEEKAKQFNAHYFFKALTGSGELLETINKILA